MERPTAVVTGGSGGIGGACVESFAIDHDVVIHYWSNQAGAEESARRAEELGAETLLSRFDLSDERSIAAAFERIHQRFDVIDVLVNNAGMINRTDFLGMSPAQIQTTLAVNLSGVIFCTREALGPMQRAGAGRIVNVSSRAGVSGSRSDVIYGASKAGVIGFTKSLARQYTDAGIFANVVAPGTTDTAMIPASRAESKRASSPIGRLVRPAEIAEAVRFFGTTASISGRVLEIDGGTP